MSNWIFPAPSPSTAIRVVSRTLMNRTVRQDSDAGKEARIKKYFAPRYRFEVEVGLRGSSPYTEMQRVVTHLARHAGMYGNFLFQDPEDNSVTDHGFGVGDGATTSFQLQRTLGGPASDILGTWDTYTKPRTNRALYSQDVANAAWTKTNCSATGGFIAPDGTTAAGLSDGTATGQHYIVQSISGLTIGATYTVSAFMKAGSLGFCYLQLGGTGVYIDLSTGAADSGGNGTLTSTLLGSGWWRISTQRVAAATSENAVIGMYATSGTVSYTGANGSIYVWGVQVEAGGTATHYVPTTSAIVRADPAYWPAIDDGFEPVFDPVWRSVAAYTNGAADGTWLPGPSGTIVYSPAPASGAVLSWTGSYYRRVRCNDDEPKFERILPGYWKTSLEFESVLP